MAENKPGIPFLQAPPEWTPGQPGDYEDLQNWYGRLPAEQRNAIPPNMIEAWRDLDQPSFASRWASQNIQDLRGGPPSVWDPTSAIQAEAINRPQLDQSKYAHPGSYFASEVPVPGGPTTPMAHALGYNDIERAHLLDVLRLAGYDVSGVTGMKK